MTHDNGAYVKVVIRTRLHAGVGWSQEDIKLRHDVELPFSPFVGLEITDGDFSVVIREVGWNVSRREFVAWTDRDQPANYRRSAAELEGLAAEYEESGWVRE